MVAAATAEDFLRKLRRVSVELLFSFIGLLWRVFDPDYSRRYRRETQGPHLVAALISRLPLFQPQFPM